jgi:polyferredoxin
VFGRFFCGWVCPLGTTLDGLGRLIGRGRRAFSPGWRRVKYYLLFALSAAALGGVQLLGLFDPLAIFLRSLALALYPAYNYGVNRVFDGLYAVDLPVVTPLAQEVFPWWRDHLMAFHQPVFALSLFTLLVFLAIVLLERIEHRFWCKHLCPLGALLGLCARHALLQRTPQSLCAPCQACNARCRSGAVRPEGHRRNECLLCMDCTGFCPEERVSFRLRAAPRSGAGLDLERRGWCTSPRRGTGPTPILFVPPAPWRKMSSSSVACVAANA